MPNPLIAMMGVSAGSSLLGASAQARAADKASSAQAQAAQYAADAQTKAAQMSIDEQRRQFDAIQQLYKPYIGAGTTALGGMMDLNGLNGSAAQQTAINGISGSPQFAALRDQGFNAINQNAAATGGLRGGNNQAALAQFAPQMLQSLIQQQYAQLGGIAAMGQSSAAGQASSGQNFANAASAAYGNAGAGQAQAFGQIGAAQAGNYIAQGNAISQGIGGIAGALNYGFGQAMQPANLPNGTTNPAALPGPMFGKWGF